MSKKPEIKLKVCGMKQADNLEAVAALQPDFLGFIFYPKSKRYMAETLSPEQVRELSSSIQRVGVFVNAEVGEVLEQAKKYDLDILQLHGDETPEQCAALKGRGYQIVKAFGLDENFDFEQLKGYAEVVDFYLFDTKGPAYGGNGVVFDWSVLKKYDQQKPFFLSGGLGIEEVKKLDELPNLPLYAIDVNSRFEIEPGLKDPGLLRELKQHLSQKLMH